MKLFSKLNAWYSNLEQPYRAMLFIIQLYGAFIVFRFGAIFWLRVPMTLGLIGFLILFLLSISRWLSGYGLTMLAATAGVLTYTAYITLC